MPFGMALAVLSAACAPQSGSNEVDIGNAARAARGAIGKQADESKLRPQAMAERAPAVRAALATGAGEPVAADDARAAATAVRRYFDLVAKRRYDDAWRMWDDDGAASGLSAEAFGQSFEKFADYQAVVGAPGPVESGAGQRYITVPVRISGTLRDGQPFAMEGPVTLHRVADIDGASAARRQWRISESGIRPRPATDPTPSPPTN